MFKSSEADVGSANTLLRRATERIGCVEFGRHRINSNMESKTRKDLSDLARIEPELDHPVELFRLWYDEAQKYNPRMPNVGCLATTSKDCQVSARNVVLREYDNDGFVIVTDNRSKKVDNIENVPYVAMTFFWFHVNEQDQEIAKQVRVEGVMKKLEKERFKHLYDREPLYCKIRSHLGHQGAEVDWNEQKRRHDKILDAVRRNEKDVSMPDHFVGYKLFPTMMEFYFARDHLIGDRLLYRKDKSCDLWTFHRVAA